MMKNGENPYKFARKAAAITVEAAAAELNYPDNVLYNIEQGRKRPDTQTVKRMIKLYKAPWLAYEHTRMDPIAAELFPPLDLDMVTGAYVRMCKETRDTAKLQDRVQDLLCDGEITDDERQEAEAIAREHMEAGASHFAFAGTLIA